MAAVRPRPASVAVVAALASLAVSVFALAPGADAGRDLQARTALPVRATLAADRTPETALAQSAGSTQIGSLGPAVPVTVASTPASQAMRPGFLGLSIEFGSLSAYLGTQPAHVDPVFLALVRALSPGGQRLLRIGGNSTDRTWWPVRGMRRPASVDFALSKRWLEIARAAAGGLGGKLLLGVNLGADSPRLAGVEAREFISGIGTRDIAALEVGNEPDDYPGIPWLRAGERRRFFRSRTYRVPAYLRDFLRWQSALPRFPLAGPALARTPWMPTALRSLVRRPYRVRLVTFHRYPLRACETNPQAADYPTIPRLLSDTSSAGLADEVAPFVATAHSAGGRFRLDELNSASCTGKRGVSNTFASALWAVKVLFSLAAAGVDGVNVHMLPGSAYQAFSVARRSRTWSASVAPLYYGLLMFTRAFPPGARLLRVSDGAGSDGLSAWATRTPNGRIRVALVNVNPARTVTVALHLPGAGTPLAVQRLLAPSVSATGGVSLGGESFGARTSTGVLPPPRRSAQIQALAGTYTVSVPGGSAVLLTR